MADKRLQSIRNYFDTTGMRLRDDEKDILCNVIDNPDKYNGYTSRAIKKHDSGKDYRGRWESTTETKYKINIDENVFSVDEDYRHSCDDGYESEKTNHLKDVRDIIGALRKMGDELNN